jgi:hypothetical protein
MGAQAGKDARVGRSNPSQESIVDASGSPYGSGRGAAFCVTTDEVVIDGFTIEGGTNGMTALIDYASGIFVDDVFSVQILNNIVKNNAVGVYSTGSALVKYNLFQANNSGTAGSSFTDFAWMAGFGIALYKAEGSAITYNEFEGNLAAAVAVYSSDSVGVTNNTSKNDGSFAVISGSTNSSFCNNQGQDFGAQGFLPIPLTTPPVHADAAIDVIFSSGFNINDNDLEEGKTEGYSGIAFSTIFNSGNPSGNGEISGNVVKRFADNGIVAEASEPGMLGLGTLEESSVSGNDVEDNGNDGILIEDGQNNYQNSLVDNKAEGNYANDCEDDTAAGTPYPMSTWFNNIGSLSLPAGLCTPAKVNGPRSYKPL